MREYKKVAKGFAIMALMLVLNFGTYDSHAYNPAYNPAYNTLESKHIDIEINEDCTIDVKQTYVIDSNGGDQYSCTNSYELLDLGECYHNTVNYELKDPKTGENISDFSIMGLTNFMKEGKNYFELNYKINFNKDTYKDKDVIEFKSSLLHGLNGRNGEYTFNVKLPNSFDKDKINIKLLENKDEICEMDFDVDGNTIRGNANNVMIDSDNELLFTIETAEGDLKGDSFRFLASKTSKIFISVLGLILSLLIWFVFGKDNEVAEIKSLYSPSNLNCMDLYYRSKGKMDTDNLIGLLIGLANNGFIKFKIRKDEYSIIQGKEENSQDPYENTLLANLFNKYPYVDSNELSSKFKNTNVEFKSYESLEESRYDIYKESSCIAKRKVFMIAFIVGYILQFVTVGSAIGFTLPYALVMMSLPVAYVIKYIKPQLEFYEFDEVIGDAKIEAEIKTKGFINKIISLAAILATGWGGFTLIQNGESNWIVWCMFLLSLYYMFSYLCESLKNLKIVLAIITFVATFIPLLCASNYMMSADSNDAFISMGIAVIIMTIITYIGDITVQRTPYGDKMLGEAKGFIKNIRNMTEEEAIRLNEENPAYFYYILPYAISFGVHREWISKFKRCRFALPNWYMDEGENANAIGDGKVGIDVIEKFMKMYFKSIR